MAKAAAKRTDTAGTKKPRVPRPTGSNNNDIEKVSEEALGKLHELGIEEQLQRDLQWCLGSYRSDGNPVGLYDTVKQALRVLKNEKEKKTKGITSKLINDIEKVVKELPD